MEEAKKEELFSAIYMASQFGHHMAARGAFEKSLDEAVNETLQHIIKILEQQKTIKMARNIEQSDDIVGN